MAARVAATLQEDENIQVETRKGGLGEFSVYLDGQKVIDTNRLWYPNPARIIEQVRALTAK